MNYGTFEIWPDMWDSRLEGVSNSKPVHIRGINMLEPLEILKEEAAGRAKTEQQGHMFSRPETVMGNRYIQTGEAEMIATMKRLD